MTPPLPLCPELGVRMRLRTLAGGPVGGVVESVWAPTAVMLPFKHLRHVTLQSLFLPLASVSRSLGREKARAATYDPNLRPRLPARPDAKNKGGGAAAAQDTIHFQTRKDQPNTRAQPEPSLLGL